MQKTYCLFPNQCLKDATKIWMLDKDSAMTCPSLNTICQLLKLPPTLQLHHLHSINVRKEKSYL